jgi:transcriptional regulator with XRE-family HTH domain
MEWNMKRIEALRIRAGRLKGYVDVDGRPKAMFQEDFAREIGTRVGTVQRWLKGRQVPNPMACRLLTDYESKLDAVDEDVDAPVV